MPRNISDYSKTERFYIFQPITVLAACSMNAKRFLVEKWLILPVALPYNFRVLLFIETTVGVRPIMIRKM